MSTAGFYRYNGETLDYAPTTVWLPSGQILKCDNPPTGPVDSWGWYETEQAAYEAHGLPWRERARDDNGWFIGDDPSTPDVNEAWVTPKQGE